MAEDPQWYLFDYGMVISTAPEPRDWELLEEALGAPARDPDSPYWLHREDFDAGRLTSAEYWTLVRGREVSEGEVSRFDSLDALQWSHLNLDTLDVLEDLYRSGKNLALLSNMPLAMAEELSKNPWAQYFKHLFFSGKMGIIKPEAQIFQRVLDTLEVPAQNFIFIDDKQENIDGAAQLGFQTIHHVPGVDLQKELSSRS